MIERIKQRIAAVAKEACGYAPLTRVISEAEVKEILEQEEKTGGWIPVSERLPDPETEVLITARRKYKSGGCVDIITTAFYEDGNISECDSCWNWVDIDGEYDEENDCYIVPEECRAAVEKQTAKLVIDNTPTEDSVWYQCPTCKGDLTTIRGFYCQYCGQKLHWR